MITTDMIGRIRRLRSRRNKSEREISGITGLPRTTIAKWLHGVVNGPLNYRHGEHPNKPLGQTEILRSSPDLVCTKVPTR